MDAPFSSNTINDLNHAMSHDPDKTASDKDGAIHPATLVDLGIILVALAVAGESINCGYLRKVFTVANAINYLITLKNVAVLMAYYTSLTS